MEECLLALSAAQESPTDEMFVHQVRLQLIVQRVSELPKMQPDWNESSRAPLPFYLKVFRSQLLEVQSGLSPEAECNGWTRYSPRRLNIALLTPSRHPTSIYPSNHPQH
jgi:hypothetical protein